MRKISALIALFCILAYVAAVVFGAYRVYTSIEGQRRTAVREVDEIKSIISANGSAFFEPSFRDQIRVKLEQCRVLEGVIITGSRGELAFEREKGRSVAWEGRTPRFTGRFGFSALPSAPVDVPGLRNVNVYALVNTINYEYLIQVLKETLFVIILALALAFFTLIIQGLTRPKAAEFETPSGDEAAAPETRSVPDVQPAAGFTETESEEEFAGTEIEAEAEIESEDASLPDIFSDESDFAEDDFSFNDLSEGEIGPKKDDDFALEDFLNEDDLELPDTAGNETPASAPNGLYSPRSGLGWEAYTRERLASELHRCAASEQDLVVFLMECGAGVNCDGALYKKLAEESIQFFNMKDLSFEKGERGFTVILPNADLDLGISRAEEFHARVLSSCRDSIHARGDFTVGLSSRSGRLIDGDRLLFEASNALQKAMEEQGPPIVAFRSDPEKYREFIRQRV
ncbi:MAG: hypothetical protein LBB82_09280 [Treponema sp.]|jgi:hypothetical protein|nr:hypothetical protein [Treponema sp.]